MAREVYEDSTFSPQVSEYFNEFKSPKKRGRMLKFRGDGHFCRTY